MNKITIAGTTGTVTVGGATTLETALEAAHGAVLPNQAVCDSWANILANHGGKVLNHDNGAYVGPA